MRALLPIAFAAVALAACAGPAEKRAASESPGNSAEMEDLEPDGPFDATLENEPGEE